MAPHVGVGGWTPRPRKLSADSDRIKLPTFRLAAIRDTGRQWGRMWINMILKFEHPIARAESTKVFSLNERTMPRNRRAKDAQPTRQSTKVTEISPGVK